LNFKKEINIFRNLKNKIKIKNLFGHISFVENGILRV
jgi:hypothetical protein